MDALIVVFWVILGFWIISMCGAFGILIIKKRITPVFVKLVLIAIIRIILK